MAVITLGSWVVGGTTVSICEGDAISDVLFLGVIVVLIIRFWSAMTGDLNDAANVVVCLYNFLCEEGAPQGFIFLDCLLLFDLKGSQVSFKVENQVEFYHGKL